MNLRNVKSTIVNGLLDQIAPHYCCSCGEIGSLLCESCKYDITSEPTNDCLLCGSPTLLTLGCKTCRHIVQKTWHAGERTGGLERLINQYKFDYAEAAYKPLGDILLACLPDLPLKTVIVPIPTIRAHIRQRGYDHIALMTDYIASRRGLKVENVLRRTTAAAQRGATRKQRLAQAKVAFVVSVELDPDVPYLLIDDIVTTGATVTYAAKSLRDHGATTVWAAAVARQPLD